MNLKVTFLPEEVEIAALPGLTLLDLARRANIGIAAQCGGRGTCGKCQVRVVPAPAPSEADRKAIPCHRLEDGWRLACQTKVSTEDLTVFVPPESRVLNLKILVSGLSRDVVVQTPIKKAFLKIAPPTIEDQRSDWERLTEAIATATGIKEEITSNIYLLRRLPELLRRSNFEVTAVLVDNRLISLESGDTTNHCYGVAFDLGTTTIVGSLLDIRQAKEVAVAFRSNPQAVFGADVISRINYGSSEKDGSRRLLTGVVSAFNEIIEEMCAKALVDPHHIYEAMVAGNSAMEHLFLGLPASSLTVSPYVGAYRKAVSLSARSLGFNINDDAVTKVAPLISGFVGGDTVAGILATNIHRESPLRLFIDIGTNGEIVVGNREGLWCASAAAGPAFEGANIHHGMRAEAGAIDKVHLNNAVNYSTIGEALPRGICGTGLVEGISELLRIGVLTPEGRLKAREEISELPPAISSRIQEGENGRFFLLAPETGVSIFQKDIRQLQLAKAAIAAGIELLLEHIGLSYEELDEVLLAGAFGSYIDPVAGLRLGLLPPVPLEKIHFVGNTALVGAKMMLLSEDLKKEAERIPQICHYVELFHESHFMDRFVDKIFFPPTASGKADDL